MSDGNRYQPCPECGHLFRWHRGPYMDGNYHCFGFTMKGPSGCLCTENPFDHPKAEMSEDPRRKMEEKR